MNYRILLLALSLVVGACSSAGGGPVVTRPDPPPTTTEAPAPTTTTTSPLVVEGAPPGLGEVVSSFYDYALGEGDAAPAAPDTLIASIVPASGQRPTAGTPSVGAFDEDRVAVVEVGLDIFLLIDDGSGWRIVAGEWPELGIAPYFGEGPRHVVVVGSDARPGEPMDATRADSIHFVALDGTGGGAVVGLPRDSYVSINGGGKGKITGSLALGGPDAMMKSFRDLTELPLEGYVLTGFSGFESLVDGVLGGVEVDVPFAINDKAAKAALSAGVQLLDGFDALAFARARKTVPGGDFTRSEHQGKILVAAAKTVRSLGPSSIPGLMEKAEPSLMTSLTAEELFTFSYLAIRSDLDNMPNIVASGSAGRAGAASVVYLHDAAYATFADLADGRLEN